MNKDIILLLGILVIVLGLGGALLNTIEKFEDEEQCKGKDVGMLFDSLKDQGGYDRLYDLSVQEYSKERSLEHLKDINNVHKLLSLC
jgi:hypothetical protein